MYFFKSVFYLQQVRKMKNGKLENLRTLYAALMKTRQFFLANDKLMNGSDTTARYKT